MNILAKLRRWWHNPDELRLAQHCQWSAPAVEQTSPLPKSPVELFRDASGELRHVRIGEWRVIAASHNRRIAEVRELRLCQRVAIRIELGDALSFAPTCTIWELYNLEGRLVAMLQTAGKQDFWLATDYPTHGPARTAPEDTICLSA